MSAPEFFSFVSPRCPRRPDLAAEQLEVGAGSIGARSVVEFVGLAAVLAPRCNDQLVNVPAQPLGIAAAAEDHELGVLPAGVAEPHGEQALVERQEGVGGAA